MTRSWPSWLRHYWELVVVAVAAAVGLTVQRPLATVVRHQGIDVLLVILVFSTAITIEPRSLGRLRRSWRQLALALVVGATVLPALSWVISTMVAAGSLRHGVMTIGVAPCEIASIATTAMAGGDVALAGGLLIGSTVLTVAVAGPILALEVPGASVHPGHIVFNLVVVVAVPLAVGLGIRSVTGIAPGATQVAATSSTLAVAGLVALIASEVHLSGRYVPVLGAVVVFVIASAGVGLVIGRSGGPPMMRALLLTTSMRDFAVAAALATAAFGPAAAAALGVYGIAVLLWGTGAAGFMRARHAGGDRSR